MGSLWQDPYIIWGEVFPWGKKKDEKIGFIVRQTRIIILFFYVF